MNRVSISLLVITVVYLAACKTDSQGLIVKANGVSLNIQCSDGIAVPVATCPSGYVRNPFSNTCLRLVTTPLNWDDAKASCEGSDEHLAVLDGVADVNWFEHYRRTHTEWSVGLWMGGRLVDGEWVWRGRVTTPILAAEWEDPQPNGNGPCLNLFNSQRAYKWDDGTCSFVQSFVCELVM